MRNAALAVRLRRPRLARSKTNIAEGRCSPPLASELREVNVEAMLDQAIR